MRKSHFVLLVFAATLVLALTPAVAMANYSIHGGYTMDTDACAGCHRAHTAASSITWTRSDNSQGSALLLSTASENYQFCYTCHDAVSLGADTNVEEGIYEGTIPGNVQGGDLNGGGFEATIFPTQHMYTGSSWMIYGGSTDWDIFGAGFLKDGPQVEMSCSSCHDVHGSSNYRLLKDVVNGRTVGGYDDQAPYTPQDPNPMPWVVSAEPGYPAIGWLLHEPGASQVSTYFPNYTTPMYAKAPGNDPTKGISGWCAACHIQYIQPTGAVYDDTLTPGEGGTENLVLDTALGYDSNDGFGYAVRHRHPVNVELANYLGPRPLNLDVPGLPLAHDGIGDVASNETTDWIDCMTCHVAHGSKSTMEGYANVADSTDPQPDSGTGGVPPTDGNALLRLDNRGVCESCHNK